MPRKLLAAARARRVDANHMAGIPAAGAPLFLHGPHPMPDISCSACIHYDTRALTVKFLPLFSHVYG
jgi:hypothetical protein